MYKDSNIDEDACTCKLNVCTDILGIILNDDVVL